MTTTPEREALAAARDYVTEAATRYYDGTSGDRKRKEAERVLAMVNAALAASPAAGGVQALPHGWRIEAIVEKPFKSYRITAPSGYEVVVHGHERNPANVLLYRLAGALAASPPAAPAAEPQGRIVKAPNQGDTHMAEDKKESWESRHPSWPFPEPRAVFPSQPPHTEAPAARDEREALDWIDDFIARWNGDDRGACEPVNVLRRALAARAPQAAVSGTADPVGQPAGEQTGPVSAVPTPQAVQAPQPTVQAEAVENLLNALVECERRLALLIEREQHKMLDVVARDAARAAIAQAMPAAQGERG